MRTSIAALRALSLAALLVNCAVAQTAPDFSGVFLQTPGPLILRITQSPDTLDVTSIENGESVSKKYRLDGTSTVVSYLGYLTRDSIHFKKETLRLDSTIIAAPVHAVSLGEFVPFDPPPATVSEIWNLSSDGQVLRIKRKVHFKSLGEVDATETYHRESSLDAALKDAHTASLADVCNRVPALDFVSQGKHPAKSGNGKVRFTGSAHLADTELRQLTRSVFFHADLFGDFFNGLEQVSQGPNLEFRMNQSPISTYGDSIMLDVFPTEMESNPYLPEFDVPLGHPPHSADLLELRFAVRWLGSVQRDLGEVRADMATELFTELRAPNRFYQMEIPSAGIPLSDDLEVRIFSADGKEMGCIRNHI